MPSSGWILEPYLIRFRGFLIRVMNVNYENIKDFFFTTNFLPLYQCQGVDVFWSHIRPVFVGFQSGLWSLIMKTSRTSFSVLISCHFIKAKELYVFDPHLTRFRGFLIRDMYVNYENIKDFFFKPNFFLMPSSGWILEPYLIRFCRFLIRVMDVNYENIMDLFFSTTFLSLYQCQGVTLFWSTFDQISWVFDKGCVC